MGVKQPRGGRDTNVEGTNAERHNVVLREAVKDRVVLRQLLKSRCRVKEDVTSGRCCGWVTRSQEQCGGRHAPRQQ